MSSEMYRLLADFLNHRFPDSPVHCMYERPTHPHSLPLATTAKFFDYVVLDATRYYSSTATGSNRGSLVEVDVTGSGALQCGELLDIVEFQRGMHHSPVWLGRMRWFKPWTGSRPEIWDTLYAFSRIMLL